MAEHARDSDHATSTGVALSAAGWLDVHFEASRAAYEAQVRQVGIQPGWRVLDAACGAGSYLPWLAELVGPAGRVDALDLTPENVATVERRVAGWSLPCPVAATTGTVLALPYPDDTFDAAWFANTSQYLDDGELLAVLREFGRVVRPGGLVAVKDSTSSEFYSLPPFLLARLKAAVAGLDSPAGRHLAICLTRTPVLRRWLERAGLVGVRQEVTLIAHWAPFSAAERQYALNGIGYYAGQAAAAPISAADRALWAQLADAASERHPANDPAGYYCEGNVLAIGAVPAGTS